MTRLHLCAAATFVEENGGRTLLTVSVSDDSGNPIGGLTPGSFTVIDLLVAAGKPRGGATLRVEALNDEGPSFYSMLLANDAALNAGSRQAFIGEHTLLVNVQQRHMVADQLTAPPHIVIDSQGFNVATYSVA
jgi:hypothetical protein